MKSYRRIPQSSSWSLPPTAKQCAALARYGVKDEEMPDTRAGANKLIYDLHRRKKKV